VRGLVADGGAVVDRAVGDVRGQRAESRADAGQADVRRLVQGADLLAGARPDLLDPLQRRGSGYYLDHRARLEIRRGPVPVVSKRQLGHPVASSLELFL
jgi:hypothetical protein